MTSAELRGAVLEAIVDLTPPAADTHTRTDRTLNGVSVAEIVSAMKAAGVLHAAADSNAIGCYLGELWELGYVAREGPRGQRLYRATLAGSSVVARARAAAQTESAM